MPPPAFGSVHMELPTANGFIRAVARLTKKELAKPEQNDNTRSTDNLTMSHADATYSFFGSCDFEPIPDVAPKKLLKEESSILPVTDRPQVNEAHAMEEWLPDTSYGLFSCPSMNPEPVHKVVKPIEKVPELKVTPVDYEGYTLFGI